MSSLEAGNTLHDLDADRWRGDHGSVTSRFGKVNLWPPKMLGAPSNWRSQRSRHLGSARCSA